MVVDFDTANSVIPSQREQRHGEQSRNERSNTQFAALMAQYAACPLFAPWPATDPSIRFNPATFSANLSAHPASSNRREGRHERE